mgnify:CR=1 FL=1
MACSTASDAPGLPFSILAPAGYGLDPVSCQATPEYLPPEY